VFGVTNIASVRERPSSRSLTSDIRRKAAAPVSKEGDSWHSLSVYRSFALIWNLRREVSDIRGLSPLFLHTIRWCTISLATPSPTFMATTFPLRSASQSMKIVKTAATAYEGTVNPIAAVFTEVKKQF
jgi:hypothetical protein